MNLKIKETEIKIYFNINLLSYMKNLIFGIVLLIISPFFCFVSCNYTSGHVAVLKQRIDKAEMVEYVDSIYGAELLYPDFFKIDSVGKGYACFSYSDKNVKELSLTYCKYPPRLFGNTEEAVKILSDSLTTFSRVKTSSFILTEEYEYFPQIKCVSKFYRTLNGWTSYSLVYEKQYEDAVVRLAKMVKDWKIYEEDTPRWFSDMCDFLDI